MRTYKAFVEVGGVRMKYEGRCKNLLQSLVGGWIIVHKDDSRLCLPRDAVIMLGVEELEDETK